MTRSRWQPPCAIDALGVTLRRWPLRPIKVPLARVDRFEVILRVPGDGEGWVEHLVLLTCEGKALPVSAGLNRRRGPSPGGRAQALNNELMRVRRAAGPRPAD